MAKRSPDVSALIAGFAAATGQRVVDSASAVAEAAVSTVERICAVGPVVIVVDDLHWADEVSLLVWRLWCQAAQQGPLLVAGGARPVPRRPELTAARRAARAGGSLITLTGLSTPHLRELARSALQAVPAGRLLHLVDSVNGNPLYLVEVLDALSRAGWILVKEGGADLRPEIEDNALPTSLASALTSRLEFLSSPARRFLTTAALLGTKFSLGDVATVAGDSAGDVQKAVAEAIDAAVIEEADNQLAFRHPLLRRALYQSAGPDQLRARHLSAARALAAAKASVERVAEHLLIAAGGIDESMVEWLTRSAPRLTYSDPRLAVGLLKSTTEAMERGDPRLARLSVLLVEALFYTGDYPGVERTATPLLERLTDPADVGRAAWHLGYALLHLGRPDRAGAVASAALCRDPAAPWPARLTAFFAITEMVQSRPDAAEAAGREALAAGRAGGDALAQGYALHALDRVAHHRGRDHSARRLRNQALTTLGDNPEALDLRLLLLNNTAWGLVDDEDWAGAQAVLGRQIVLAERAGAALRLHRARIVSAQIAYRLGRWDEALAEVTALGKVAHAPTDVARRGVGAMIAARRGDDGVVDSYLAGAPAWELGRRDLYYDARDLVVAVALSHEPRGRPGEALCGLRAWADPLGGIGYFKHDELPLLLRLALAAGDRSTAEEVISVSEERFANQELPVWRACRDRCRGLWAGDVDALVAAREHHRASGRLPDLAGTLEDLAVVYAEQGDKDAARRGLTEALRTNRGFGAAGDSARAVARLSVYGVQPLRAMPRQRRVTGWAALTSTELDIARMIADGRSNPDIAGELYLSRRTVDFYVSRILRKLAVHSRVEIAQVAVDHAAA